MTATTSFQKLSGTATESPAMACESFITDLGCAMILFVVFGVEKVCHIYFGTFLGSGISTPDSFDFGKGLVLVSALCLVWTVALVVHDDRIRRNAATVLRRCFLVLIAA